MYSTAEEVREMLKTDTLDALIGDAYIEDEREREAKIRPLILQAIQDADGEIDGYLAKRYTVPLPSLPEILSNSVRTLQSITCFPYRH